MPVTFEFATANRIIFGAGSVRQIGSIATGLLYERQAPDSLADHPLYAMVITRPPASSAAAIISALAEAKIAAETIAVEHEPTVELAQQGAARAHEVGAQLVIGIGGGAVIDAGKAIAALMTNPGDPYDYLEVVGRGKPLPNAPVPYIAIPTTAGTGAEVTRNAVLASPQHQVKVSLRSPLMLPRVALVDPELTYGLPPEVTASTGLDALTQLIEPLVSNRANPLTDAVCREGIMRAARSLLRAYQSAHTPETPDAVAREDMAVASLFGGLALANARLGAVHGFAAPIGGMFPAPHGAVCAALLPHVMAINVEALRTREPGNEALRRYDEIGRLLTGDLRATAADGVQWVSTLCASLKVPPLGAWGVTAEALPILAEKGAVASSMQGNPIKLTSAEMHDILSRALA